VNVPGWAGKPADYSERSCAQCARSGVPTDPKSPNRLDALVWAFSELRGLAYGSVMGIFAIVTCANQACGNAFSRKPGGGVIRTHCPRCGTPIPEQDDDTDNAASTDSTATAPATRQAEPGANPLQPAAFPVPPALTQMLDRWQGWRR
jgi:hypothetical protein